MFLIIFVQCLIPIFYIAILNLQKFIMKKCSTKMFIALRLQCLFLQCKRIVLSCTSGDTIRQNIFHISITFFFCLFSLKYLHFFLNWNEYTRQWKYRIVLKNNPIKWNKNMIWRILVLFVFFSCLQLYVVGTRALYFEIFVEKYCVCNTFIGFVCNWRIGLTNWLFLL